MGRTACICIAGEAAIQCAVPDGLALSDGDECIVEVGKTLEYGRVARLKEPAAAGPRGNGDAGSVVRRATLQDRSKAHESAVRSRMARETCAAKAQAHQLNIKLIGVRFSFDKSVLRVMFRSDERVDFRAMVKELAEELRTRVDMRQIGVRDEAATLGGLGPCGRPQCCCTWLRTFESINVKMAKAQCLSLKPATIGGMCGRLKCCLRYEHELYKELGKDVPREGVAVRCPDGIGSIVERNVLRRRVRVRLDDGRILDLSASDVERIVLRAGASGRTRTEAPEETEEIDEDLSEDPGTEWSQP